MFIVSAMEKVPVDDNDQPLEEIKIISHNLCDSTHGTRGRGRGREGKRLRSSPKLINLYFFQFQDKVGP
ncbi:hypothetical protein ES319_D03G029900v1 [Gossypium barbadense]|uniref:Uncharacterized protein n=1 Tax=Gossypium barbadense TaxID=3634 RepID=A0A5J5S703_GOSBA|nr:hypothetical protein ES319_D03G029900v1 [Gossypium barbadense]